VDPKTDAESRYTPLHDAARFGPAKLVQWLVEHDADINAQAHNQLTALDLASDPEVVAALLKGRPNVEPHRSYGTPLQRVAEKYASERRAAEKRKWLKIVEQLKAAGATYDLVTAVYLDDLPHVRKLLAADSEVIHDHCQRSPLRIAASYGRLEIFKELLSASQIDVDDIEQGGGYPIIIEVLPFPEMVRLLMDHGADFESTISWRGSRSGAWVIHDEAPLLHYAADRGVPETIKLLLDEGADPFEEIFDTIREENEKPQTALDVAAIMGRVDNLLAIINHPAFRDAEFGKRQILLNRCLIMGTIAFQTGSVDHVKLYKGLLEAGASPSAIYGDRSAIQAAAAELDLQTFERAKKKNESLRNGIAILRAAGAKLDLFSAAALGEEATVREILKENPAEASMIGPDGVPAIHMAVKMNQPKIIAQLLAAGCDVNLRNQSENIGGLGTTPLDWAHLWGTTEILDLLEKHKAVSSSDLNDEDPFIAKSK
jgi:uncharacterized protein